MAFNVTVNNNLQLDLTEEDIKKVDSINTSEDKYHILQNNMSFKAEIVRKDYNNKTYDVQVNNNLYSISIADDLDLLVKEMGFSLGSTKHVDTIKAPMPGLILDINVKIGQEVKEDETLIILEVII